MWIGGADAIFEPDEKLNRPKTQNLHTRKSEKELFRPKHLQMMKEYLIGFLYIQIIKFEEKSERDSSEPTSEQT